jgi:hypothetical protein
MEKELQRTKRKRPIVSKKLCWEMAPKAQSMVDEANLEQTLMTK